MTFIHMLFRRCIINVNPLRLYYVSVRYFTFYRAARERCPSVGLSVCLSVRLSVKRVDCDKTEESSAKIFIP